MPCYLACGGRKGTHERARELHGLFRLFIRHRNVFALIAEEIRYGDMRLVNMTEMARTVRAA